MQSDFSRIWKIPTSFIFFDKMCSQHQDKEYWPSRAADQLLQSPQQTIHTQSKWAFDVSQWAVHVYPVYRERNITQEINMLKRYIENCNNYSTWSTYTEDFCTINPNCYNRIMQYKIIQYDIYKESCWLVTGTTQVLGDFLLYNFNLRC